MCKLFQTIALLGHPRHSNALVTHEILYYWLKEQGYDVIIEETVASSLPFTPTKTASLEQIGKTCSLAIVIGGDGNMLSAARVLAHFDIKLIGVNRGQLGFLTDLNADNAQQHLTEVLKGDYIEERRFLISAEIVRNNKVISSGTAVNEVVLHPRKIAHMMDYEVYINDRFAFAQHADGLIVSTPTGSTAYSLSAGGSILVPSLEAFILVPMFPHTLTSRPIVINNDSIIRIQCKNMIRHPEISCDSQLHLSIHADDEIIIKRSSTHLNLIHPLGYSYFNILNTKLNWSKSLI